FGYGHIRRACRHNTYLSLTEQPAVAFDRYGTRRLMKDSILSHTPDRLKDLSSSSCYKNIAAGLEHSFYYPAYLGARLSLTEDHFREALSDIAVMIDSGKAYILIGQMPEPLHYLIQAALVSLIFLQ